jgi:hypothetical protein
MIIPAETASVPSTQAVPFADQLRLAVAAYVARFKGTSREHTESDLRCSLSWCAEHTLDPLAVQRADLKKYVRWMQETRRFSVTAGFYRICAIDGILDHSPRRARPPPRSVCRITDFGLHPPAVRGAAHRRPCAIPRPR